MSRKTDLQLATEALRRSSSEYRNSLLAQGGIREAIKRAMGEADPLISQLRTAQGAAQQRLGTVFTDSMDELKDITDPAARERIRATRSAQYGREAAELGGRLSDVSASRDDRANQFASLFGATTAAKQFDVGQKQEAVNRAFQSERETRERAFQSRFDDLTRREKEASIAAANRSNRGGALTFAEQVANPFLAFLAAGGKRTQNSVGGYSFFDKSGKPITVDQAAAMVPGGTRADFLAGSRDASDAPYAYSKQQQQAIGTMTDNIRQDPDVKDFVTVRDYFERIKSGAQSKSGVGDLSMIFSYMKVLDPTSVVRETEYKNAADAIGKIPQLANIPSYAVKGTKLTEQGRRWFTQEAERIYNLKRQQHERALSTYRRGAEAYGIDPDLVLRDYGASTSTPHAGRTSSGLTFTVER